MMWPDYRRPHPTSPAQRRPALLLHPRPRVQFSALNMEGWVVYVEVGECEYECVSVRVCVSEHVQEGREQGRVQTIRLIVFPSLLWLLGSSDSSSAI